MRIPFIVCVAAVLLGGAALRAQPPAPQAPEYAWAAACKPCHAEIYDAWARTKHATALERLSSSDQEKACLGCHVTGPKAKVLDGRRVLNAGVQCEQCHGGAAAHVADPANKTGLIKKPKEAACVECHSDKSPHFKGFWFDAMSRVVHHVRPGGA
jgi:hypothetical protein